MKPALPALIAFLNANDYFPITDLYTIQLVGGGTFRFLDYGLPSVTIPSANFPGSPLNYSASGNQTFTQGPRFGRSRVTTDIGIKPAELKIQVYPSPSDVFGQLSWQQFANTGGFDGATIEVDRFFMPRGQDGFTGTLTTELGCIVWFYGLTADVDTQRSMVEITVKSPINLLSQQQMPRRLFQSGCTHIFGDMMCGYDRINGANAGGQSTGVGAQNIFAQAGSTQLQIVTTLTPSPSIAYDQGTIKGITGANAGYTKSIVNLAGGIIAMVRPWPQIVTVGDEFEVIPGCNHTASYCNATLNNLARYGGFDYIPPPEIAL